MHEGGSSRGEVLGLLTANVNYCCPHSCRGLESPWNREILLGRAGAQSQVQVPPTMLILRVIGPMQTQNHAVWNKSPLG